MSAQTVQVQPVDAPPTEKMADTKKQKGGKSVDALMGATALKVKQKASLLEAVSGGCCEKSNKYSIKVKGGPGDGKKVWKAKEKSECLERLCCAPGHAARIMIEEDDDWGDEVAYTIDKPFKCAGCCSCADLCQSEVTIYRGKWEEGGDNEVLGRAHEVMCGGFFTPTIDIFNGKDEKNGQLRGPTCCIGSCCDTKFGYFKEDGEETSAMIKKEGVDDAEGAAKELFTDADTFKVKFTDDMDEGERATLLGAMLLLDFMFFEDDGAIDLQNCNIKCCDLFCCGCTVPIQCNLKGDDGGGD